MRLAFAVIAPIAAAIIAAEVYGDMIGAVVGGMMIVCVWVCRGYFGLASRP